jgi:putative tryptophan/tyrosine transport system substrate-binding protein
MKRMLCIVIGLAPTLIAGGIHCTAAAQTSGRMYRLAVISPSTSSARDIREIVLPELARMGFAEGRNLTVSMHVGALAQLPELGVEAVATQPDVVIASTNAAVNAILATSRSVPVVMAFAGEDPVAAGIAKSLARPGGSVTGLTNQSSELDGKRLSLLHDIVPGVRRIGILAVPPPRNVASIAAIEKVAGRLGLQTTVFVASRSSEYPAAFASMRAANIEALVLASAPEYVDDAAVIARLAIAGSLPTIGEAGSMALDGLLIGYGPNRIVFRRRAADLAAKILRGTPPGEIPIEQATTFEFKINLQTAKALGITVAPILLGQADEVIE